MSHKHKSQQEPVESQEEAEVVEVEGNILNEEEVSEIVEEELDPIAILEREKLELKDAYLRLSAETDNYRKRMQLEKENFKKIAVKDIVERLLPVIDNMERSINVGDNTDNIASFQEGIQLVLQQFEGVLKDAGLETVEVQTGDEFDPQYCEAVMMEERDDVEHSMTIVDVFEKGRKLGGQVIRTAKVKVAKKI